MSTKEKLLLLIFFQSLIATLGSLYFSNYGDPVANILTGELLNPANGFEPCKLCWWARILMYPTLVLSSVGLMSNDHSFAKYTFALASLGIPLELYHYLIQRFPIYTIQKCSLTNPCNAMAVNYLGFITIPFLCLVAFIVIWGASLAVLRSQKQPSNIVPDSNCQLTL